ncbi:hypothetical protein BDY19DRAFT_888832 [Irpex rosettiformis]|uniref:Uncharacterized protein n=1 Tax=Irpex rosettiformis TaxID=378272 RepID=A0ACB8U685_9APHY|nr:hypothetical protein BDY19DRAFT_888832 [Irpex rosettiformis]
MDGTTLPIPAAVQIPNVNTDIEPTVMTAYRLCYDEEQRLLLLQNRRTDKPLIHIRILGWMFVYNLGIRMLIKLAEAVTSCRGIDGAYDQLGQFYLDYWIRPFRIRARTPYSSHPSRPAFEAAAVDLTAVLKEPELDHSGAKALALERDGYCCVLTGVFDRTSIRVPELRALYDRGKPKMYTECTNIFSKSTNGCINDEAKRLYAGRAWAVLESFGYGDMLNELGGSGVYHLENILTLEVNCYNAFNDLALWLEPTVTSVTFTDHARPEYRGQIPLPSKRYLRVHAACCGVAAMSGAGEYLDKVMQDQKSIDVLSADGGSSDVAVNAVWKAFYHSMSE